MSNVYAVEVMICATAYIRADSEEQAAEIANEHFNEDNDASTLDDSWFGDVEVSDVQFDSEDLPEVSLSPAMAFTGKHGRPRGQYTADDVWTAGE